MANASGGKSTQKDQQQNSKEKKKKFKNVALIHSLPKNLEEEAKKFFENDLSAAAGVLESMPEEEAAGMRSALEYLQRLDRYYSQVARPR